MLGREVATLVNERQKAGTHAVTFDGERLASGVYFYRQTVCYWQGGRRNIFTDMKKMMVIK
jgi:hypothetical protein